MVVHLTIWVPVIHTSCRPRMKIIACCRSRSLKPIIKCNPSSLLESSGTTGQQDPSGVIQTSNTGGASVTDTLSLNNSALSFHSLDWTLLAWKWWMLCVVISYCSRYVWRHTNNIRQFNFTTSQFAVQLYSASSNLGSKQDKWSLVIMNIPVSLVSRRASLRCCLVLATACIGAQAEFSQWPAAWQLTIYHRSSCIFDVLSANCCILVLFSTLIRNQANTSLLLLCSVLMNSRKLKK